ncbi:hypothetical protein K2173_020676 [Erythroxylum novogranatense]|uniref:Cation/H+ exchanger transmembrane domain-containing protein n=1 Tax=Erythroxylum novogranatense TaxID=1862640 RepID=A0AAV8TLH7_9ROSI|nr:hypothetical protein K2173_020676 [Erythroxylum novogranatense]
MVKKASGIAVAGITFPFIIGIGTSYLRTATINKGVPRGPFLVFMGVSRSITAFPVLARILAELKLLTTDLCHMAMSAAAVNDVAAWVLLALAIALSNSNTSLVSVWVLLCGAGFVIVCVFTVKPLLSLIAHLRGSRCNWISDEHQRLGGTYYSQHLKGLRGDQCPNIRNWLCSPPSFPLHL